MFLQQASYTPSFGGLGVKLEALRKYRSQEDAQELADLFETHSFTTESFHQVYPPVARGAILPGLWE